MSLHEITDKALTIPIPNLDAARDLRRGGYAQLEVNTGHPLYGDPVVSLADYGVQSRSYYSRRNVTGDPIPGVRPDVVVRRDVAERLARINHFLAGSDVTEKAFGAKAELFVDDGIRSVALQGKVYNEQYPNFLRSIHSEWTEEQIAQERDRRVAKPSENSPHAAGAIDLKFIEAGVSYDVEDREENHGSPLSYGVKHDVKYTLRPDYYEANGSAGTEQYLKVRRLMWAIMHEAGFQNNPEEIWHYGTGDKLAALIGSYPPYYGAVEGMPEFSGE